MVANEREALARPVRRPKQQRGQRTREAILRAAERLIEREGLDITTTDIARAAHVAVGSVYAYFADKQSILLELFERQARDIGEALRPALDPSEWMQGSGRVLIRRAIHAVVDSHRFRPGLQRVLLTATMHESALASALRAFEAQLIGAMSHLLGALKSQTRIDDPEMAAYVIYHSVEACCHQSLLLGDPIDLAKLEEALVDLVTRFVLPDERPRHSRRRPRRR
jgi:AcrR family transcriptional regulator